MQFGVVLHVSATYANWNTFLTIARKENLPVADESVSLEKVLYALYSKKVIGSSEFDILRIIIDACDRAVHAERIDFVTASQIVDIGESAVSYLDSLREKSEEH